MFKNNARRPYSIHPNGVTYTKQTEGLSYEDGSKYWFKDDNEVQPGTTCTYVWQVPAEVGPKPGESHCRTWVYYSGVNIVSTSKCTFFFNHESGNSLEWTYKYVFLVLSDISLHLNTHKN